MDNFNFSKYAGMFNINPESINAFNNFMNNYYNGILQNYYNQINSNVANVKYNPAGYFVDDFLIKGTEAGNNL